jgi:hypothetical protein
MSTTTSPLLTNLATIISTALWFFALGVTIFIVRRSRKEYVGGTPIVLKKFVIDEGLGHDAAIEIVGRRSGILSWLLNLFKLEQNCSLAVTDTEVTIRRASLGGVSLRSMPFPHISATICGYQRSIMALAIAVFFAITFVISLLPTFLGNGWPDAGPESLLPFLYLVISIVAMVIFLLSKRIGISIETAETSGLAFKASVIENVSVDLAQAVRAIAVLNGKIIAAQGGHLSKAKQPTPIALNAKESSCPKCASQNPAGTRFCESCGTPLMTPRPARMGG